MSQSSIQLVVTLLYSQLLPQLLI